MASLTRTGWAKVGRVVEYRRAAGTKWVRGKITTRTSATVVTIKIAGSGESFASKSLSVAHGAVDVWRPA